MRSIVFEKHGGTEVLQVRESDDPTPGAGEVVVEVARAGVNFIDTADVYNGGRSEEVTGRAIRADRDWWVLATKLGNPTGPGPNDRGLSRRHCLLAAEASLRRLGAACSAPPVARTPPATAARACLQP